MMTFGDQGGSLRDRLGGTISCGKPKELPWRQKVVARTAGCPGSTKLSTFMAAGAVNSGSNLWADGLEGRSADEVHRIRP
jgi:hypothetical protein